MDEQDARQLLAAHRVSALERIAEMTAEFAQVADSSADTNVDDEHDPEGSTVAFERAQLTAFLAQARDHLRDVNDALRRLDAGEYGRCERCGAPIGDERLTAVPVARRCIACASRPDR